MPGRGGPWFGRRLTLLAIRQTTYAINAISPAVPTISGISIGPSELSGGGVCPGAGCATQTVTTSTCRKNALGDFILNPLNDCNGSALVINAKPRAL